MKGLGKKASALALVVLMLAQMIVPTGLAEPVVVIKGTIDPLGNAQLVGGDGLGGEGGEDNPPPTVTFVVDSIEYEEYTVESGLLLAPEGLDGYTCSYLSLPKEAYPEGMVSFRGWFLEGAEAPFDFNTLVTESIVLTAQFSSQYLLAFKDGDGKVVHTEELPAGSPILAPPTDVESAAAATAPEGQYLVYWAIEGSQARFTFGTKISQDLTLVPVFSNQYYVIFISAGTQVENSLQWIAGGTPVAKPADPTRPGYSFLHWSEEAGGGTAYNFSAPVEKNTTLYAVWQAKDVDYTVAIWMEKPIYSATDFPNFAANGTTGYNYVHSVTLRGKAGDMTNVNGETAEIKELFTGSHNLLKYAQFQGAIQNEILGNGLTVVNLYATRKVYTYMFDLGNNSNRTMTIGGTTYTGNNNTKFSLQVKYEMDISGIFPVFGVDFAAFSHTLTSWARGSGMRWKDTAGIASRRNIVDEGMLSEDGQQQSYTLTANWSNDTTAYNYRYLVQVLPGQNPTANTIVRDGKTYVLMPEYNQTHVSDLSAKSINGLSRVSNDYRTYYWNSGIFYTSSSGNRTECRCFFYDRSTHKLTFNMMAGSDAVGNKPVDATLMYQQSLADKEPSGVPTREGYRFAGWYRDASYNEPFDFGITMPNGPMTVYAKWESTQNIVSYYNLFGDAEPVHTEGVANGAYASGHYRAGQIVDGLGEFIGWFVENGAMVPFSFDRPITQNFDLYAQWRTDGFTVTYDKGVGTGAVPTDSNTYRLGTNARVEDGSALTGPNNEVFYAWKDPAGNLYYPGSLITMNGSVVLTAQYVPSGGFWTVTYVENFKGSLVEKAIRVPKASNTITLLGEIFRQSGATLTGWNTQSDENGVGHELGETGFVVTGDVTLYGCWINTYTVVFRTEHGGQFEASVTTAFTAKKNDGMPTPTKPPAALAGYHFVGWVDDASTPNNYANLEAIAALKVSCDIVFTAHFEEDADVTITYEASPAAGGTLSLYTEDVAPASETPAGSTVATENPGYTFTHWTVSGNDEWKHTDKELAAEDMPASVKRDGLWTAVTYTAHFVANTHTLYIHHLSTATNLSVYTDPLSGTPHQFGAQYMAWSRTREGYDAKGTIPESPFSMFSVVGLMPDGDVHITFWYTPSATILPVLPDPDDPEPPVNPDPEITPENIADAQARLIQGFYIILDDEVPLAGMASRNMGDCPE